MTTLVQGVAQLNDKNPPVQGVLRATMRNSGQAEFEKRGVERQQTSIEGDENQENEGKQPDQVGEFLIGKPLHQSDSTLGKTLGKGTFGKVKLGTNIITKEKAAIKILDKDMLKDSSDNERVSREIKILKTLRHPNVVQLYDVRCIFYDHSLVDY
jgi:hypothetical protein